MHARVKVRLPIEKKVISESRDRQGQDRSSRRSPRKPNGLVHDHRRPRDLQRHPQAADAVLRSAAVPQALSAHHRRLLPAARPPRDDRPARPHEGDRLPRIDALRACRFATDDLQDAAQQGSDPRRRPRRKSRRSRSSTSAASSPSRSATTRSSTCGPTPATRSPKQMMARTRSDDVRGGKPVPEPDLPDGPLRRPRRRRADSPARRHARPDGQAVGQIIETPIKANFREGLTRARVLQLDARRPQGPGRHGPQDRRLRLPHAQAGRRGAERRHHHARLRHDAGHHQGRHLQGRGSRTVAERDRFAAASARNTITRSDGDVHRRRKRDDHAGHGPQDRGAEHRQDRRPQPDDLPGVARRLPAVLRHGPVDRRPGRRRHGGRHHRRPVDRRAGHAAHDAYVPHRRRRQGRHRGKRDQGRRRPASIKLQRHQRRSSPDDEGERDARRARRATARSRSSGRRTSSSKRTRSPTAPTLLVNDGEEVQAGHGALPVGPAHDADPRRERRHASASRTSTRAKRSARRRDASGAEALRHHGAQGRAAPADRHRGRQRPEPRRPLHPRAGVPRSRATASRSSAGTLLAKTPREVGGTQDITGGLPRVTEIFEARKPRDPAVMAEISGKVRLGEREARQAHHHRPAGRRHRQADRRREGAPRARTASTCASTPATTSRPATRSSTARSCRTTSCASAASRRCRTTWSARCRRSTAASASRSTTSTSRSSSRRCCAR